MATESPGASNKSAKKLCRSIRALFTPLWFASCREVGFRAPGARRTTTEKPNSIPSRKPDVSSSLPKRGIGSASPRSWAACWASRSGDNPMFARIQTLACRTRAWLWPRPVDQDFDQELAAHLDLLTEENVRRGMSPEAARRAACIRLGGYTQLQETNRELHGLP